MSARSRQRTHKAVGSDRQKHGLREESETETENDEDAWTLSGTGLHSVYSIDCFIKTTSE